MAALTTATVELASCGGADAEQERRDAAAERREAAQERREERQLERGLAREEFANPMRRFVALDAPEEFPAQWLHHRGGGN